MLDEQASIGTKELCLDENRIANYFVPLAAHVPPDIIKNIRREEKKYIEH